MNRERRQINIGIAKRHFAGAVENLDDDKKFSWNCYYEKAASDMAYLMYLYEWQEYYGDEEVEVG